VPWARRGKRLDEQISILRGLGSGEYFSHHGEIFDVPEIKLCPVPDSPVPILIGGHADAALRRAARNDGWLHGGGDPEELPGLLDKLARFRAEEGTAGKPFSIQVISMDAYTVDGIKKLEARGVTDVIVGFRWPYTTGPDTQPLTDKVDALRKYADSVIAKVS
jgi:hypothetical protein